MDSQRPSGFPFVKSSPCANFTQVIAVSYRSVHVIPSSTSQILAVGGLCGLSSFRASFRIMLADVCGPECRQMSLCAVFDKIVFSPTRNAKSNTTNRPLARHAIFISQKNTCSRLREMLFLITLHIFLLFFTTSISFGTFAFPNKISCQRFCARSMPRNRLEIGVPTLVSYRVGRCFTRLEVWLES